MVKWTAKLRGRDLTVTSESLDEFKKSYVSDIELLARMSESLWFDIFVHFIEFGIDPSEIMDAIYNVEKDEPHNGLKPATEFTRAPLKGLWHKHYFTARFLPANISLALGKNGLEQIIERILDPAKYPIITPEAVEELTHAVVNLPVEKRDADGRLTGEWVVFAKHGGKNYYLALAIHSTADQVIYDNIMDHSTRDFPNLKSWLPA